MNSWDTYQIMFNVLDDEWDKTKNRKLGDYLSEMNPYLFEGIGSADPAYYSDFKELFESKFSDKCSIEEGYNFSKEYIESFNDKKLLDFFNKKTLNDWIEAYSNKKN